VLPLSKLSEKKSDFSSRKEGLFSRMDMNPKCPNCDGENFVEDPVRGDSICVGCGGCLPERLMDETLEKRNFSDSNKDHNRGSELDKYLSFASQSEKKDVKRRTA
jgi:transcription initiation factor TFIIIB Brf1 subunit/transcription initiation factor TFIIB